MKDATVAPDFGPLAGVRVVYSGQATAGPFTAQLMADFGADVLWIENPAVPDLSRAGRGLTIQMERRNQRTIALNIPTPNGSDILLRLLETADIFVESSKGGQFRRWGLGDDVLWEANPQLVIVHVSGYGQEGDPRYVQRAAFDSIAQAFGCYLELNGPAEGPPIPAKPVTADYMTGLFACSAALAALHRARQTGEGDSIDVAMFEVMLRAGGGGPMTYLNYGELPSRADTLQSRSAGMGLYPCRDGLEVYVILGGAGVILRAIDLLGLDASVLPANSAFASLDLPGGKLLDAALREYCLQRSAREVDDECNRYGIPCSMVYTYDIAARDPHYQAREVFTEWTTASGEPIRGVNVVPKFAKRPGQIWRGGPATGTDTEEVLLSLGFDLDTIDRLHAAGIVRLAPTSHS